MRFNSLKELEEHIFLCDVKLADLKNELESYYEELKKLGLFNPLKKDIKDKVKKIKKTTKELENEKEETLKIFNKYTTFKYNVFLEFLAKYISLVEKEEYVVKNVHESRDIGGRYTDIRDTYFKIITTLDNVERMSKQKEKCYHGADTSNINNYLRACIDDKYLALYAEESYTLLEGTKLNNFFCKYPYLKELAYEIVDTICKNPMLTDRDILNAMLEKPYEKKLNK